MKSDEGIFKMLSKSSIIRNQYENVTYIITFENSKKPPNLYLGDFFLPSTIQLIINKKLRSMIFFFFDNN